MNSPYLSWSSARNFCIVHALAKLGHYPTSKSEKEAWFLSPLRSETQASFNVSLVKNLWYDFGEGKGGNVIDLVIFLLNCSFQESLLFLSENSIPFSFCPPSELQKTKCTGGITVIKIKRLINPALLDYLAHRKISKEIAEEYCREVNYQIKGKTYFSLGLQNQLGGWELRNRYCKNATSPKCYTYLTKTSKRLIIIEGMFDFLSLVALDKELVDISDTIILNSLAFTKDIEFLIPKYKEVLLFLDNDQPGDKYSKELIQNHKDVIDKSGCYIGYKDLNEKLISNINKQI